MKTFSRITLLDRAQTKSPVWVLLPGGMGLSSACMEPMGEALCDLGYAVALVDPAGTGGTTELADATFQELGKDVSQALERLPQPLILVGHSFGANLAMELLRYRRLKIAGLVALNMALTEKSLADLEKDAVKRRTEKSARAEEDFLNKPSNEAYRTWFISLAPYYFSKNYLKEGEAFLKNDQMSALLFLGCASAITEFNDERLLALPRALPKLLIAGESDALLSPANLKTDARKAGFDFLLVPKAGHFTPLEAPTETAELLSTWWKQLG